MPYVIAIAIAIAGLVLIRDALYFAEFYQGANAGCLLTLGVGILLIYLAWFIFKETITKTYTIRKR